MISWTGATIVRDLSNFGRGGDKDVELLIQIPETP